MGAGLYGLCHPRNAPIHLALSLAALRLGNLGEATALPKVVERLPERLGLEANTADESRMAAKCAPHRKMLHDGPANDLRKDGGR